MFFANFRNGTTKSSLNRGLNINEGGQAPNEDGPMVDEVPNEVPVVDVNAALTQIANAIAMQAGRNAPTPASRIRDFTRMNPPEYLDRRLMRTLKISLRRSSK